MGIKLFSTGNPKVIQPIGAPSAKTDYEEDWAGPGNPNPWRFQILKSQQANSMTAVEVQYPDATNYEGRKVLVLNKTFANISKLKNLDPHFFEDGYVLARFKPDASGWQDALDYIQKAKPGQEH